MKQGSVSIHYHGFHAPEDVDRDLAEIMEELQRGAPKGSFVEATFHKRSEDFKVNVHIHSAPRSFFSSAEGLQIKPLAHKVVSQLRRQLEKWKHGLHEHESIKNLNQPTENPKKENGSTVNVEISS